MTSKEICKTNPNCEIKPSNCEYVVRCTTYDDLKNCTEAYVCGRNNCKEIMGDKEMEKIKMLEEIRDLKEENELLKLQNKKFEDSIAELSRTFQKIESKIYTLRMRFTDCKEDAINDKYTKSENGEHCGLNFDSPLDFAKSIIEHKTHVDGWTIESDKFKTEIPDHERVTFGYDELIEIAEYLLIYCKHNKEDL